MQIVLLKSVDNLGQAGDKVDVKRGYFRNYLEPRLMALVANAQNLKLVESKKKKLEAMVAVEVSDAQKIKGILEGQKFEFKLRAGDRGQLFGSVTSRDVVDAIKEKFNIEIERRKVDMENLKTLGDHSVKIRVYPGVIATINAHIDRLIVEGEELAALEAVAAVVSPDAGAEDEDENEDA